MNKNIDFSIGSIHSSNNYGDYKIIEKLKKRTNTGYIQYRIKFLLTGYELVVESRYIKSNNIRDPYYPIYCRVACMGIPNASYELYIKDYSRWKAMIKRCYDPKDPQYHNYGAEGVKVCDRWLCFENYYEDIRLLPGYDEYIKDPDNYQLDKDTLQSHLLKSQRIYSPETCMFVNRRLNSIHAYNSEDNKYGYYGVGTCYYIGYSANIKHHDHTYTIGVYSTPELAAGAYNYFVSTYYPYMPLNPVYTLTMEEVEQLDVRNNKYSMCRIIK